ncbi:hypothetical protein GOP47_0023413 [Adiantum capillus-veneris]|uniref:Uncharacterized protein n=1 Tax=Adiantum capillus-veneris TaxID=13818 RepID=A0A9D4Z3C9_ADICA|nr:hypothetical protein GOP47_0023413 [Adiantum capillus-veneris]
MHGIHERLPDLRTGFHDVMAKGGSLPVPSTTSSLPPSPISPRRDPILPTSQGVKNPILSECQKKGKQQALRWEAGHLWQGRRRAGH